MKTLYRTAFALTKLEAPLTDIHKVAKVCYDWVFEPKPGRPREGLSRPACVDGNAKSVEPVDLGAGWRLQSMYLKGKEKRSWGMRVEHPDQADAGITWRIEVVVDAVETKAVFSCRVEVLRNDSNPSQIQRKAGQPGVVARIIESFGAKDLNSGIPLPLSAGPAKTAEIGKLIAFLVDPRRQQAVVLVSRQKSTGEPTVDASLWAKKLSSLAYVIVAEDQKFTYALGEKLGPDLICYDGSVRIYYPGFTTQSNPYDHSLLTPGSIAGSLELRGQPGLAEEVQSQITDKLAHRGYPGALFWGGLKDRINAERVAALTSGTDDSELAQIYAGENAELHEKLKEQNILLGQLQSDIATLRHWRGLAGEAISKIRRGSDIKEALKHLPEVDTVDDALRVAAAEHKDRLVLCLNSKSDSQTPFTRPTDVLNALRWLCTTFYDSKANGKSIGNPDDTLSRAVAGWSYAGNQTDTTLGRYEEWYKVNYHLADGKTAYAEQHMKYGTGNDPAYMIRIGFLWDDAKKVWVIGYIGLHQKNTKS